MLSCSAPGENESNRPHRHDTSYGRLVIAFGVGVARVRCRTRLIAPPFDAFGTCASCASAFLPHARTLPSVVSAIADWYRADRGAIEAAVFRRAHPELTERARARCPDLPAHVDRVRARSALLDRDDLSASAHGAGLTTRVGAPGRAGVTVPGPSAPTCASRESGVRGPFVASSPMHAAIATTGAATGERISSKPVVLRRTR